VVLDLPVLDSIEFCCHTIFTVKFTSIGTGAALGSVIIRVFRNSSSSSRLAWPSDTLAASLVAASSAGVRGLQHATVIQADTLNAAAAAA
jgi:hypothetical protein